jgi:hypothetical protein
MALWQWEFCIVPRSTPFSLRVTPKKMDLESYDSTNWWAHFDREDELVEFFDKVLARYCPLGTQDVISWGSDDGDRVHISLEDKEVWDISIRLDLRSLNRDLVIALVEFARKNGYVFYAVDSGTFLEPNAETIFHMIYESRKMKFVRHPEEFFADKAFLKQVDDENRKKI